MKVLNNKIKLSLGIIIVMLTLTFTSCESVLDKEPVIELTESQVFDSPESYQQFLARIYAGIAVSGQQGPAGQPDILGIDEGFSNYLRQYWKHQELTTDEAIIAWRDGTIHDLHNHVWTPANEFIRAMYDRIYYQIGITNQFLRETTDEKLDGRGVDAALKAEIQIYNAEARFMRALSYWHALDIYGEKIPFVDDLDKVGTELPEQAVEGEVFKFIEDELIAIESILVGARQNELGRADKAAAWMLLAKLYMNAEVYTGTARYSDAMTYINKIISAGYSLTPDYSHLFLADNDINGAQNETIFSIRFDGLNTIGYSGTTFLTHAAVGGTMNPVEFGINGGWGGLRTTKVLVEKFNIDIDGLNTALGTKSAWGLVGSATTNGWGGPDMEMYETATDQYALYAELAAGEVKFRFDEDWGINLGANDADGSLESDGSNIAIATGGTYFITVNVDNNTYSISPFTGDSRNMFHTEEQTLEIEDPFNFGDGYAIAKWRNVDKDGNPGKDASGNFVDTDFPMFRLADAFLMYAEVTLRGGGGDAGTAVGYINMLRERSYGSTSGNISAGELTLDFILAERSRELFWEGHRRTDLIRFGQFTDQSVWPWKGGVMEGKTTESFRDIYPIPSSDITANPNLTQNPGY
ncbi:MAG: RagB/SusD family nutrient uptake outer membrane protein [Bacteroidota bacterium]